MDKQMLSHFFGQKIVFGGGFWAGEAGEFAAEAGAEVFGDGRGDFEAFGEGFGVGAAEAEEVQESLEAWFGAEEGPDLGVEVLGLRGVLGSDEDFARHAIGSGEGFDERNGLAVVAGEGREIFVIAEESVFFAVMEAVDESADDGGKSRVDG